MHYCGVVAMQGALQLAMLEESAVVVSPGSSYGASGEGFFRISLTISDNRLSEAVERLRSSLGG